MHYAGMPVVYLAVGVLVLVIVVAWTLLQLRTLREIRALKRDLQESARDEAASERRIRELLGAPLKEVNGKHHRKDDRPHLWLVPVSAVLSGGLLPLLSWMRNNPGPIGATLAGVAAVTALVIAGSSTSDTRVADPPRPVTPTEAPSSTTVVSPPGTSHTHQPSGGGTPTQPVRMPTTSLPPVTVSTTVPATATATTVTTTEPTITLSPTATTSKPCLLRVSLKPVADLCVPG